MNNLNKIMILSPHVDDGILGCGASINRFIKSGAKIHYVNFQSFNYKINGYQNTDMQKQLYCGTKCVGIDKNNLISLNYDIREYFKNRQQILEDLVVLNKKIKPDMILMPSLNDLHQDHKIISQQGIRAFKKTTVMCYQLSWNNINFQTNAFISFNIQQLNAKLKSLQQYKSQSNRNYINQQFIRSLAIIRGTQIDCEYAQSFQVIRLIVNCF